MGTSANPVSSLGVLAVLGLAGYGFSRAGLTGVATGLVVGFAVISGTAIARGSEAAEVSPLPEIRTAQRIGGAVSASFALAGALWVGWKWGWAAAVVGYLMGAAASLVATMAQGIRVRPSMQGRYSADLPPARPGRIPIVDSDDFFVRTSGGRPSRMNMSVYEGHAFLCACGMTHAFHADTIEVVRELAGMHVVFACPKSDALVCVKISGGIRFTGFESLFGTTAGETS